MSLLTELDAFYTEHRQCGELDAGVEGPVVWFDCECGASTARRGGRGRGTCLQQWTRAVLTITGTGR